MNALLRRFATILLLLAVPLRVYAAVAMMFCGAPSQVPHELQMGGAAMHGQMHDHRNTDDSMESVEHHEDHDARSEHVQDHGSCAACCCAGMIATAHYDWKPQSFATPATPGFVAIAVPPTVPHRLERPPRVFLA